MLPLNDARLHRVDTTDDIAEFFRWLARDREVLACDTETTGLTWYRPDFRVRLVQFGDVDDAYVLRADRFGAVIEEVLTKYDREFVFHNMGFDIHALRAAGFTLPRMDRVQDTLMLSKILDSRGFHTLKGLSEVYFGPVAAQAQKLLDRAFEIHGFGKDKGAGFAGIAYGVQAYDVYSAVDVILTARLYAEYAPRIVAFQSAYENEMAAWWVTIEHEAKGLRVDLEYARRIQSEYEQELETIGGQLRALGIQNPNSKAQKLKALTLEGFTTDDFTESGEPKLDKQALERFASPTALLLIEHSRIEGWLTKYINKIADDNYKGRIYPGINPFGAKTGRESMSNPPLQQLPGRHPEAYKIRAMILPEEGDDLWAIDYDGQENRLLGHFSGDQALIDLIMSGEDIHRYTAATIYGVPAEAVTKEQRSIAKTTVYASQYGAGAKKIAKNLDISVDEARLVLQGIDRAFPSVAAWKKRVENEGRARYQREGGAYAYTWAGRRVYADQFEGFDPSYYTLTNYMLQGTGADVLKTTLNRIAAAGLSHYIMLPVHDELLFSLPKGPEGVELAHELARIMTYDQGEFLVPLTCQPDGPMERWQPH